MSTLRVEVRRAARFFSAAYGILAVTAAAIWTGCAVYTGESVWQPLLFAAVAWLVLTAATLALTVVVEVAGRWSDQ